MGFFTVVHNCHDNNKTLLIKKISQIKKFCFHITRFAHIHNKASASTYKKPTVNSHGKFSLQIPKYVIQKMVWRDFLCGRASRVKIKRKQLTKQKLWELISLICKTNISNISEISYSWKWLTQVRLTDSWVGFTIGLKSNESCLALAS